MKQSGLLGYFGLLDWYISSFNSEETNLIKANYKPMGGSYEDLIEGDITMASGSPIWLLNAIAGFLINKNPTLDIGLFFLHKGETLVENSRNFTDMHFLFLNFSKAYKAKGNFEKALEYSRKMVDISENVSDEFIKEYGKNEVSHQGFIDCIEYFENEQDEEMISTLEEKARKEQWRGPWNLA